MSLTIELDERALAHYLQSAERRWPTAVRRRLEDVGRALFEESQRLVPVGRTGRLRSDAMVVVNGEGVNIRYLAPYAQIVHFKRVRHLTGQRLFLSQPLGPAVRSLPGELDSALRSAITGTA